MRGSIEGIVAVLLVPCLGVVAALLLSQCPEILSETEECIADGGRMYPVESTCRTFLERTATQPRFCNDNDRDESRHCFAWVRRCEWRCEIDGPVTP
jgi:hypothetical protein